MEILDYITIMSILGFTFGVLLYLVSKITSPKKATKKGDNSISDLYDVYNTQVRDILKIKDTQISSLTSKLKRLEAQDVEILQESNGKDITFEEIQAIVQTKYPKASPLLLLMKKQIMEATKGMTKEQILGYVTQFTQNKEPGTTSSPEALEYRKDWA